ncbi:MAG TPA: acyl carrier protein [Phycisphaerae bacterium]
MNEALRKLLADVFGVKPEKISERDSHETIPAWDSLRHLQMVMALEQQYGIQIDTEQIANIKSVADVVRLVETARGSGGG